MVLMGCSCTLLRLERETESCERCMGYRNYLESLMEKPYYYYFERDYLMRRMALFFDDVWKIGIIR